jgi:hypothetical protein
VGNPPAGFDEAGAGNGLLSTAPVFDPTDEGLLGKSLYCTSDLLYKDNLPVVFA